MEPGRNEDEFSAPSQEPKYQAHAFIREGKLDLLRDFLDKSPDSVHATSFSGTFLAVAIGCNNVEATRILLDAGASPLEDEWFGNCFYTSLEYAAAHGNRDLWRLLLDRLKTMTPSGIVVYGHNEQELVDMSFVRAAVFGHAGIVAEYLDAVEWAWSHGILNHVLACAAARWHAEIVDLLLGKVQYDKSTLETVLEVSMNDRINVPDVIGRRVLYVQSDWEKHYHMTSRLIDASGIDLLPKSSALLSRAAEGIEKQGGLRALLERGADPNTQWEGGYTALHLLAFPISMDPGIRRQRHNSLDPLCGHETHEVGIRLLIQHGASITIRDDERAMASHLAAEGLDTATFLRYYLPSQPALAQTNVYGESLLHYAAAGGKYETLKYLLSGCHGFNINSPNSTGWTPLICALAPNSRVYKTEHAAINSARLLLSLGADPTATTDEGWTIWHVLGSYQDRTEMSPVNNRTTDDEPELCEEDFEEDRVLLEERWVRMSDPEFQARYGALDRDSRATDLARELLNGPLDLLPSITSPARVYSGEVTHKKNPCHKAAWGGRLGKDILRPADRDSGPLSQGSLGDMRARHGQTPLHWAAEHGAAGVARLLCEAGADKGARDSEGMTPWDLADRSRIIGDAKLRAATKSAVSLSRTESEGCVAP